MKRETFVKDIKKTQGRHRKLGLGMSVRGSFELLILGVGITVSICWTHGWVRKEDSSSMVDII